MSSAAYLTKIIWLMEKWGGGGWFLCLSDSVCLSVCLCLSVSVCLSLSRSVSLSLSLSLSLYMCARVLVRLYSCCLCLSVSVALSLSPSLSLSLCICVHVCLFVCILALSGHIFFVFLQSRDVIGRLGTDLITEFIDCTDFLVCPCEQAMTCV